MTGRKIVGHKSLWSPELGSRGILETLWHDADDAAAASIDEQVFAHDLRVSTEGTLPQAVAENDYRVATLFCFVLGKGATQLWSYAQNSEEAGRNWRAADALRIAAEAKTVVIASDHRDIGEAAVLLAEIAKLRRGEPIQVIGQADAGEA